MKDIFGERDGMSSEPVMFNDQGITVFRRKGDSPSGVV